MQVGESLESYCQTLIEEHEDAIKVSNYSYK